MTREEILFQNFIKALNSVKIIPSDCIPVETVKILVGDFLREIYIPKSPWISVDEDLPCNHSDLVLTYNEIPLSTKRVLVMTDINTLFLCDMKKDNDRGWIWNYSTKDKITHWFPIPELLK